ncbi:MAG: hypothetical protein GON13_00595 [Nanoarchaeota archaeon]|nr:hypothetical protein [Nanoarchaeota archaeon]
MKKCVVLISSGFDSSVAAYLMSKNCDVILLHFDSWPFVSGKSLDRVKSLRKVLEKFTGKKFVLYCISNALVQKRLYENLGALRCVLCKRSMYKLAGVVAKKLSADFLVTGDNVGQVASQTISNLKILDAAVELSVLKPLIAYDKQEIISLSKSIGTFSISSLPGISCKIVPNRPATKSILDDVERLEKKLDLDIVFKDCLSTLKLVK